MLKYFLMAILVTLTGCGRFHVPQPSPDNPTSFTQTLVPVASALIKVSTGKQDTDALTSLEVAQASGVVSVTYSRPGVSSFTLSTSGFMSGSYPQVVGDDLQLGTISINALDDNSLRVCTGVGAPANKCNRAYIRVFTLGSNVSGSITGVAGFINVDHPTPYGIDVLAGTVLTPVGFNSNQNASTITNAANVFSYTIPNSLNRLRLTNTGAINFPIKADLSNAGSGNYEMRLVVQYALGYVP